jgi:hypothetical protein
MLHDPEPTDWLTEWPGRLVSFAVGIVFATVTISIAEASITGTPVSYAMLGLGIVLALIAWIGAIRITEAIVDRRERR